MTTPKYIEPELTSISILDGDDRCDHGAIHHVGLYKFPIMHSPYKWRVIELAICEDCEGVIKKTWFTAYGDYEEGRDALLRATGLNEEDTNFNKLSVKIYDSIGADVEYIEKMAAAYFTVTNIPPDEAVLMSEWRDNRYLTYITRRDDLKDE